MADPITPPAEIPPMPDGGDQKYYKADTGAYDWPSHAKELQWKLDGSPAKSGTAEAPKDPPEDTPLTPLTLDGLGDELREHGDLSATTRARLEKAGVGADIIAHHVANWKSQTDDLTTQGTALVGGEENWGKIVKAAQEQLAPDAIEAFNVMLRGPKWKTALTALAPLAGVTLVDPAAPAKDAPPKAPGSPLTPSLVVPGVSAPPVAAVGYKTRDAMLRDMQKPDPQKPGRLLYETDPEYRGQVNQRINLMAQGVR